MECIRKIILWCRLYGYRLSWNKLLWFICSYWVKWEKNIYTDYPVTGWMLCVVPHICKCFLRILMESIWNRSTFYQNIVSQHIIWYKNSIQDYNIYVCPIFSFPDRIPDFYAESWSLYTKVYVLLPKWTAFYSKVLVWVRTREHRPVRSLWGVRDVVHVNWIAQN